MPNTHSHPADSVGDTSIRTLELPEPLPLDSGVSLTSVTIAYETYGTVSPARDNAILICHALSADAHVAGWSADATSALDGFGADGVANTAHGTLGWWDPLVGPGKAFDTNRYFVICTNIIGSCRGSTGPSSVNPATGEPYGSHFPVVTVSDMVRAQAAFLDVLGIEQLFAVAGGSLGGMQALEWSIAYPSRVRHCITTASTAALGSQGLAWNSIARDAIMGDPNWQGGDYYGTGRSPLTGMGIARMVGHVTYLSAAAMDRKFGRRLQAREQYSYTIAQADFEVESYLRYQAQRFGDRFDPNSYLCISRALTYFDLARSHGGGSLSRAFRSSQAKYLLLSFSSDWIYPTADSARLRDAIREAGEYAEHHEITTDYGHDSFLLEVPEQTRTIIAFLENARVSTEASRSSA